ncbi:MAG: tetratricopeptide repeat protein [Mariprofundaceae bacterium]|nr:tetratricopeptide repeat protein [Mariprofundaceae bacterium]
MKLTKLLLIMISMALVVFAIMTYSGFDDQMVSYVAENQDEFRKSAEQGDAGAQYHLGVMYSTGTGVETDYNEALKWYRLAAEQGHAKAQYNLGMMYYFGKGLPEDKAAAYQWVILAAERGEPAAMEAMTELAKKITSEQVASAKSAARAWSQAHPGQTASQVNHE